MKKISLVPICVLLLSACAPKNFDSIQQMSSTATEAVGCSNFESKAWDSINNYLIEKDEIPDVEQVKQQMKLSLKDVKGPNGLLSDKELDVLSKDVADLYEVFLVEASKRENVQTPAELLHVLTALELGDHSTESKVELQDKVSAQFAKVKSTIQSLQIACQNPEQENEETQAAAATVEMNANGLPAALFGAKWTMATAYQSCQAITQPAMTAATPDAQGIIITGTHADRIGSKRSVASVSALLRTHPYYKNVTSYGANCVNMKSTPLIYDYGGRPYASTSAGSSLNLFRDSGTGTKVLGIDCSAFVYTALATAGLRLSPSQNLKSTGVYGTSSSTYFDLSRNHMTCLQNISVKPQDTIRSGDIVAVHGHVLMIDTVGADPFGLKTIKSSAACSSISHRNFNFVVIQSSNSKEGIGINRYEARDYLSESPKLRDGLERYAYYACLAQFNGKTYTPNLGTSVVVRHRGTPECKGSRVALTQESCIQSCPLLN